LAAAQLIGTLFLLGYLSLIHNSLHCPAYFSKELEKGRNTTIGLLCSYVITRAMWIG